MDLLVRTNGVNSFFVGVFVKSKSSWLAFALGFQDCSTTPFESTRAKLN